MHHRHIRSHRHTKFGHECCDWHFHISTCAQILLRLLWSKMESQNRVGTIKESNFRPLLRCEECSQRSAHRAGRTMTRDCHIAAWHQSYPYNTHTTHHHHNCYLLLAAMMCMHVLPTRDPHTSMRSHEIPHNDAIPQTPPLVRLSKCNPLPMHPFAPSSLGLLRIWMMRQPDSEEVGLLRHDAWGRLEESMVLEGICQK